LQIADFRLQTEGDLNPQISNLKSPKGSGWKVEPRRDRVGEPGYCFQNPRVDTVTGNAMNSSGNSRFERASLPIRARLAILVVVTALPLVALIAYDAYTQVQLDAEQASAEALRAVRIVASDTERALRRTRELLAYLSRQPMVEALDRNRCDPLFRAFGGLFPQYTNLLTVRRNGERICSAVAPSPGAPAKVDPQLYLEETLRSRTFTVGQVTRGIFSGRWILIVAHPIAAESGDTPGIVALAIDLASLRLAPGPTELPPRAEAHIVDAGGTVLASSAAPEKWIGQNFGKVSWFTLLRPGRSATGRSVDVEGIERIYGTAPIAGTTWQAVVGIPVDVVYAPVRRRLLISGAFSLVALLLAGLLAYLTARGTSSPVEALASVARQATASPSALGVDLGRPDIAAAPKEIQALAMDFRKMLEARAAAEAALLESRNALRAMVDTSPLAIIATDSQGSVTLWNATAERMYAWCAGEALGKPIPTIPPDKADEARQLRREVLEGRSVIGYETQRLRKGGTRVAVSLSIAALRGADGTVTGILSLVSDITDRKRLEEKQAHLEAQLRQQQKLEAIGTLASGVAHEINNPLTGILNYAQLIADTAAPDNPAAGHAREIIAETERVATIVRNLLQFARRERQTHSPARLQDIVEQTLSLLRAVFRRDQITLTVDVPEDLPALKCRSQQLQQVLMNLLTNARDALNAKYSGYDADKTITVSARPFEQAGRRWLRLTVADHGPGIPPEIQARIFDPFFTTKPRDQGTGLGLSISHGIVTDHHGRLTFETEPGMGTQFHLDLPVEQGE